MQLKIFLEMNWYRDNIEKTQRQTHANSDFPKSAEQKDMSSKILFGPVHFEKIQHCMNRLAWLKRAFGRAIKPFWIWESLLGSM